MYVNCSSYSGETLTQDLKNVTILDIISNMGTFLGGHKLGNEGRGLGPGHVL